MRQKTAPTRGNLVKSRKLLGIAAKGRDLLEQKRQVLMMELVKHIESAREIQRDIVTIFVDAYQALQQANISLGIDMVEEIAGSIVEERGFNIRLHSIMGVEIPEVDPLQEKLEPQYSFGGTSGAMDRAFMAFREVLKMLGKLAEVENSVFRLAVQIRKTHRRVNSLEKVVIPFYKSTAIFITDTLEEGEREDFVRMKIAKISHNRRVE